MWVNKWLSNQYFHCLNVTVHTKMVQYRNNILTDKPKAYHVHITLYTLASIAVCVFALDKYSLDPLFDQEVILLRIQIYHMDMWNTVYVDLYYGAEDVSFKKSDIRKMQDCAEIVCKKSEAVMGSNSWMVGQ